MSQAEPSGPAMKSVETNGIRLSVAGAGPADGPPVVLLHGFPEPWFCWRHQIGPLAEAGFRVLAPDQRGYNDSDRPEPVSAYSLNVLADDILGLLDAEAGPGAALVGHDWGGIVAWWVAMHHPGRIRKLVILNAPHPVAMRKYIRTHPSQLLKSWYVFMFQIPGLPEMGFRRANWKSLCRGLQKTSRPGTFSEADLDRYREAWSKPGAMRSMINWYRALLRRPPAPPADPRIKVPTLILWGPDDRFINAEVADASLAYCDSGRLERIDGATHWVQHEEPERVNRMMIEFLTRG
ncbi:MAG: alpha/beta hydrolase [Isosphaeraceae bacterium]